MKPQKWEKLPTSEYTEKGGTLAAVITDKLRTKNGSKPSKVQGYVEITVVGAKAKTPPLARGLRCSRWSDRDKTGRDTLRSIQHQTKACGDVIPQRGLVQL
jgi:hypothetical protein